MELPKKLQDDIWDYCRLNKITVIDGFITKMVRQGYTVEKYGATPSERVVEKKVEVPVEVIVEKRVEVPVETIVEKRVEVKVTDNEEFQKVLKELEVTKRDESTHKAVVFRTSKELKEAKDKIVELETKIGQLEDNLKAEEAKPKEEKKDIYGEGKQGFFGSNTSNM